MNLDGIKEILDAGAWGVPILFIFYMAWDKRLTTEYLKEKDRIQDEQHKRTIVYQEELGKIVKEVGERLRELAHQIVRANENHLNIVSVLDKNTRAVDRVEKVMDRVENYLDIKK